MDVEVSGKPDRLAPLPARKRGTSQEVQLLAALAEMPAIAQDAKSRPSAPVMVATAESRMLTPAIWYPGTVIGRNQARIVAEVECPLE